MLDSIGHLVPSSQPLLSETGAGFGDALSNAEHNLSSQNMTGRSGRSHNNGSSSRRASSQFQSYDPMGAVNAQVDDRARRYAGEISQLSQANRELTDDNALLANENSTLRDENAGLRGQVTGLTLQYRDMKSERDKAYKDLNKEIKSYDGLKSRHEGLKNSYNDLVRRHNGLSETNQSLVDDNTRLRGKREGMRQALNDRDAEIAELRQMLAQYQYPSRRR